MGLLPVRAALCLIDWYYYCPLIPPLLGCVSRDWLHGCGVFCFVFAALLEETSGLLVSDPVSRSSSPTAIKQQLLQANAHHATATGGGGGGGGAGQNPSLLNTVALLKAKGGVGGGGKSPNAVIRRTSSYSPAGT